jgi:Squalene-hopene cyclase C-terminal domain/Prenyltransferase and squalene oxidase repeat
MTEEERDLHEDQEVVLEQQPGGWISNAPWWLVSVGIHAVLILGATLVAIERLIAVEPTEISVLFGPKASPQIADLERPRDVFDRKGIPTDEPNSASSNDEPIIFFPEAKKSDHNESANMEDYHQMKGDSKDFLSYMPGEAGGIRGRQPGKTPGAYDTMGVGIGGGSGGRYGGRFGGRENLVKEGGGTRATESAVIAALRWLAHHQGPDGGWSADGFQAQCVGGKCGGIGEKDYDTGITSLSLLAFLGAGFSQLSKDEFSDPVDPARKIRFGEVVKKGLQWLLSHQDPEGCVGERGMKYMYNHTVAALCLSEAYGMTASQPLKEPAQKAIDFVVAAQNPGKGWRYAAKCGDNDTSVSGWAIMALKSAELSDLTFPRSAYEGALNWLNEATETNGYARVGYNARGTGKVYVPGKNEQFDHHESMSAVAVMSRIFMLKKRDPALNAVNLLVGDLPEWKTNKIDFYYWYYTSLALFQYDGPDGPMWKKWNEPMKNALVPNQHTGKDGCRNGSWNSDVDRWGFEGSRVYATAINALTLEVYYRYANVFNPKK